MTIFLQKVTNYDTTLTYVVIVPGSNSKFITTVRNKYLIFFRNKYNSTSARLTDTARRCSYEHVIENQ